MTRFLSRQTLSTTAWSALEGLAVTFSICGRRQRISNAVTDLRLQGLNRIRRRDAWLVSPSDPRTDLPYLERAGLVFAVAPIVENRTTRPPLA